jgi:hypothetical protein
MKVAMKHFVTILFCLLFLGTNVTFAQGRRGNLPPWGGFDRIESYKKVRMLEVLKLDEDQSVKFVGRYNKHQDTMHGFEKERNALVDKLDEQAQSDLKDAEYDESFNNLLDLDKKISGERLQFLGEIKEVLSRRQVAEYIVFERNFARELRQAIRDVQRERMKDR